MSKLTIAFVLGLTATATYAFDKATAQSQTAAVAAATVTQPFMFDGRMRGDGARQGVPTNRQRRNAGAIVVQPKADQPRREH